jgi:hypothetical protein
MYGKMGKRRQGMIIDKQYSHEYDLNTDPLEIAKMQKEFVSKAIITSLDGLGEYPLFNVQRRFFVKVTLTKLSTPPNPIVLENVFVDIEPIDLPKPTVKALVESYKRCSKENEELKKEIEQLKREKD